MSLHEGSPREPRVVDNFYYLEPWLKGSSLENSRNFAGWPLTPRIIVWLKWVGTLPAIGAALLIAMNLSVSGYGYLALPFSGFCWIIVAWSARDASLLLLNVMFLVIDAIGIYRWLLI